MQRTLSLLLLLFLFFCGTSLFAQDSTEEDPDDSYTETEWIDIDYAPYSPGDRTFNISMGLIFPVYFTGIEKNQHGLSLGGFGALGVNYFLTSNIFIGGELSGMFSGTRGGNMLYMIPFGAKFGYQFYFKRFEFPVSVMLGCATQQYLGNKSYFGFIVKPGASVFWRYNPEWSFGANAVYWLVPQWPKNGNDVIGNFAELTLSARYHF